MSTGLEPELYELIRVVYVCPDCGESHPVYEGDLYTPSRCDECGEQLQAVRS